MADRYALKRADLPAFAAWLKTEGWEEVPTRDPWELLRMTKDGSPTVLLVHGRERGLGDTYCTIWGASEKEFRRWKNPGPSAPKPKPAFDPYQI